MPKRVSLVSTSIYSSVGSNPEGVPARHPAPLTAKFLHTSNIRQHTRLCTGPTLIAIIAAFEPPPQALAYVPAGDLDIAIFGQLAPAKLPLSDALEARPLQVIGLDAARGCRPLRQ
jgi:hypothetical protein